MARELTENEVRDRLLKQIWATVEYWEKESRATETRDKLSGLAFSILAMLDGSNINIPAFVVAPRPHQDDKDYNKERGENWFPENHKAKIACDIGGSLHEYFHKLIRTGKGNGMERSENRFGVAAVTNRQIGCIAWFANKKAFLSRKEKDLTYEERETIDTALDGAGIPCEEYDDGNDGYSREMVPLKPISPEDLRKKIRELGFCDDPQYREWVEEEIRTRNAKNYQKTLQLLHALQLARAVASLQGRDYDAAKLAEISDKIKLHKSFAVLARSERPPRRRCD